ncbi:MAG TPA: hypothetical protein VED47_06250 [Burkholderiaceae bacterium]|nr:hypothetical protein [Burkholderiaceae bacterium]
MNFRIRPSVPEDAPAIVTVLRSSGLDPLCEEQALHWKYWRPRADWPGPRSLVLTKGDQVVAHAGIVPGTLGWDGQRASVIHVIDWAAVAEAALGGRMLMKYIGGLADVLIAAGGSEDTLRLLPVLGFQRCGTAYRYVRTLHPLRYFKAQVRWNWKTLPKLARGAALWCLTPSLASQAPWSSRRLTMGDVSAIAKVLPAPRGETAIFERNIDSFTYFLECPIGAVSLHAIEQAGKVRGYFVMACVLGQARIVDSWMDTAEVHDWLALLHCAIDVAYQTPGVAEIVTRESDPVVSRCLEAAHFRKRSPIAMHVLTRKGLQVPMVNPRVQMLDSDAAYHHAGFAEFWA